jgi:hypothetical protein
MANQLEQELRRLIVNFVADVKTVIQRAALRSVQSASGVWTHVAAVGSRASSSLGLYISGALVSTLDVLP